MNTDKRKTVYWKSIVSILLCAIIVFSLSACAMTEKKSAKIKVLIVPKFEIDEISGDYPGEAQLFYE